MEDNIRLGVWMFVLFAIWFVPAFAAHVRQHHNKVAIVIVNVFIGVAALVWAGFAGGLVGFWLNPVAWWIAYAWCSIGWIVCLVWAFTRQRATS